MNDCLTASNQTIRSWKQVGNEAWRCDPWSICGVTVQGVKSFELWKDKEPHAVFRCESFAEAKAQAKKLEAV